MNSGRYVLSKITYLLKITFSLKNEKRHTGKKIKNGKFGILQKLIILFY
jgi:hypothetical protein